MRKAIVAAVVFICGGLLVWTLLPEDPAAEARVPAEPTATVPRTVAAPAFVEPPRTGTGRLAGQLVNEDGAGVAGVSIEVVLDAPLDLAGCPGLVRGCACGDAQDGVLQRVMQRLTPLAVTTSGADGGFAFDGLPDVPLSVRAVSGTSFAAEAARPGPDALELPLVDGAFGPLVVRDEAGRGLDDAVVVAVEQGVVRFADRLGPAPRTLPVSNDAEVWAFVPGALPATADWEDNDALAVLTARPGVMVSGVLLGPDRRPLANAAMAAQSNANAGPPACAETTSGVDGRFTLGPVSRLPYAVRAHAGGIGTMLTISDGGIDPPEGQVRVRGTVLTPDRRPIAGAQISVLQWKRGRAQSTVAETDAEGAFDLATGPGHVTLTAGAPGVVGVKLDHDGMLEEGQTWDVVLTLTPKPRISGRVEDVAGRPIAEVEVTALAVGRDTPLGQRNSEAETDADGRFSLDVGGKEIHLVFQPPGNHLREVREVSAPLENMVVVLKAGGTLKGRVVDAKSKPVADADVSCSQHNGTRTEEDGTFTLEGLPDGVARLEVRGDDDDATPPVVRRAWANVQVVNGQGPFTELRLETITGLRGRVEDEDGRPVAGATVYPEDPKGAIASISYRSTCDALAGLLKAPASSPIPAGLPRAVTDADGRFELKAPARHCCTPRRRASRPTGTSPAPSRASATRRWCG